MHCTAGAGGASTHRQTGRRTGTHSRGAVEERVTETDKAVAGADDELARLELADGRDAHVEALLDGRQRATQLLQTQVDNDDVAGRRADVRVLVLGIDLTTHTHTHTHTAGHTFTHTLTHTLTG